MRPEVRCTCVQFSPTGLSFAVASTEGLLVYSVDDSLVFDPFELGEDVTPEAATAALEGGELEAMNATPSLLTLDIAVDGRSLCTCSASGATPK